MARAWSLIAAAGAGALLPFLATYVLAPQLVRQWLAAVSDPGTSGKFIPLRDWVVATAVGAFRAYLVPNPVVSVLIPGLCAVAAAWLIITRRVHIKWQSSYLPSLALSVFTAPFGWFFDHAVLIGIQIRAVTVVSLAQVLALFAFQGGLFWYERTFEPYHHALWWVPAVMLLISIRLRTMDLAGSFDSKPEDV